MGVKAVLVRGGLWSGSARIVSILFGVATTALLARLLPPADLGLYFAVMATASIAAVIGGLGLSNPIVAFVAEAEAQARGAVIARGFLVAAGGTAAVTFLLLIGATRAVEVLVPEATAAPWWILAPLSAVLVFRTLTVRSLLALKEVRSSSVLTALPMVIMGVVLWVAWLGGAEIGLIGVLGIVVAANSLVIVIGLGLIVSVTGHALTARAVPQVGRYLSVGLPWLGTSILVFAFTQSGVLVTAATSSAADAAEFGIAARMAAFVVIPVGIVGAVIPPFVSERWACNDRPGIERLMRASATISGGAALIATIAFIAVGRQLLGALFGDEYTAAWAAMVAMSIGSTVDALSGQTGQMMALIGRERTVLYVFMVIGPTALLAMIILGNAAGSLGVAVGLALAVGASNIALAIIAKRSLGIRTWATASWSDIREIAKAIVSARSASSSEE